MKTWDLRNRVLAKIALGKISPNAKELIAYKLALPALSDQLLLIAIGLMLGDVSLQANKAKTAYRIKFEWGNVHKEYAFHIYQLFEMYCLSMPRKQVRVNKLGNEVTTWCFQTVMHPAFAVLANLFIDSRGKKVINASLLSDCIGPASLAYWFMDDGGLLSDKNRYGLQLHTQGFSKEEVDSLVKLLQDKYGLDCWSKLNKGKWTIAISGHSYAIFFDLIKPYIHESMKHKLPQGNRTQF
jgi:hypothetical protein